MAWNEPGGGKNKDPWGGGNGDQGPPDLDEAFRKLQDRLNGLFGGKGGQGSGSGGSGGSFKAGGALFGGLLVVALVVWALFGFYQVDQQERGIVLRLGVYHDTVMPGLHWNPPLIDNVTIVNVTRMRSIGHRAHMLTEDENIVDVNISVQYRVVDPIKYVLRIRNPEASLEQATESALRHVVGGTEMDLVITEGREQIAIEVQDRLQSYVDLYETGIQVSQVNVLDTQAPAQVQDAFDDVTRAREDRERLRNEAEGYANTVIPEARGRAQRIIEEANAYREQVVARAQGEADRFDRLLAEYRLAPEVMRERLYIEAMQNVMSNTSKVMVASESGTNLLYLPLDKMVQRSSESRAGNTRSAGSSAGASDADVRVMTDRVLQQMRRDAPLATGREGRR